MPYYKANNTSTQLHHIVPKHAGGTDDPSNLVELTTADHAEAHRQLFLKHGRWQDEIAWKVLAGKVGHEEAHKEAARRTLLGNKFRLGKKHTPETRAKISKILKGKEVPWLRRLMLSIERSGEGNINYGRRLSDYWTQERDKGNHFYGKKHTPETTKFLSERQLGTKNHNHGKRNPRVCCVICKTETAVNTFPFHRAKHQEV